MSLAPGSALISFVPCIYAHFTDEDMEAQGQSSTHDLLSSPPTLLLTQDSLAQSLFQQGFCEQDVEVTWGGGTMCVKTCTLFLTT